MNTQSNNSGHVFQPEGLTPEQLAHYQTMATNVDRTEFEAQLRELLEHPETRIPLEDVLREIGVVLDQQKDAP